MNQKHILRYAALVATSAALAGCANNRVSSSNRDYTNTSFQGAYVNTDIIVPGQYASPNSF
ncbi:hypothetical protein ACVDG5_018195 [Mesorhizobium sp. ORM6]